MEFAGTDLNVVDLVAFFLILFSVIGGIRQGFVVGFLDMAGLVGGLYLSFKGFRLIGERLVDYIGASIAIADVASFIALFIATQILFSFLFGWLGRWIKRILRLIPPLRLADGLGGTVPGLVKGIIGVALLLLPFGLFPIVPGVKAEIEDSFLGSRLIALSSESAPRLESLFGRDAEDTLVFLSRAQADKPIRLKMPLTSKLTVDAIAEQRMLELVNAERAKAGLHPLVVDEKLRQAARGHSQEMFELSYFAHESPVAGDPVDRMKAAGASFTLAAENLAYAPNLEMAHSGLMNSPGHRKNILTPGYRRLGIGVIDGGLSGKMFTQNFAD